MYSRYDLETAVSLKFGQTNALVVQEYQSIMLAVSALFGGSKKPKAAPIQSVAEGVAKLRAMGFNVNG